jgi:hypothetical protein
METFHPSGFWRWALSPASDTIGWLKVTATKPFTGTPCVPRAGVKLWTLRASPVAKATVNGAPIAIPFAARAPVPIVSR